MTADRADILGTDPRRLPPTDGLFEEFPERPSLAMVGASQAAREAIAPHLSRLEAQVLAGIVAHGPLTRDTLAEILSMSPNTVRPRCRALLDMKRIIVTGYTEHHDRRKELLAVAPPTPPEE